MTKYSLVALIAVTILSSCSRRVVDFTVISTKNFDYKKGSSFTQGKEKAIGKDKIYIIIFIPTGVQDMKSAIDKAIESVPGCVALLDGVVYSKYFWIPYIYGESWYLVEGTPLIDPSLAANFNSDFVFKIALDNKNQVKSIDTASLTNYNLLKSRFLKADKLE